MYTPHHSAPRKSGAVRFLLELGQEKWWRVLVIVAYGDTWNNGLVTLDYLDRRHREGLSQICCRSPSVVLRVFIPPNRCARFCSGADSKSCSSTAIGGKNPHSRENIFTCCWG